MGCGCSHKVQPMHVIKPISLAEAQFAGPQAVAKVSAEVSPNVTSRGRDQSNSSLSDGRQTAKHLGTVDVLCWCSDPNTLQALEREPSVEYIYAKTSQTVVFNRVSTLSPASVSVPGVAVVYLVTEQSDIPLVRKTYAAFHHIWSHFIVADCEGLEVPQDLRIPVLKHDHDLHKEIYICYMDQLAVIEAYLSRDLSQSKKLGASQFLRQMAANLSLDLISLREFWTDNRMRLWTMKEALVGQISRATQLTSSLLNALTTCMRSAVQATEGNLHFSFGDTAQVYQSLASLHIGTNATMEHIALPTASLLKYLEKDCWVSISLIPNPESGSIIDNLLLSQLAKATYDNMIHQDPTLADLFGYDLQ